VSSFFLAIPPSWTFLRPPRAGVCAGAVAGLRYLANTIPAGSHEMPPVFYDRLATAKNKSHRPYRIFLRRHRAGQEV